MEEKTKLIAMYQNDISSMAATKFLIVFGPEGVIFICSRDILTFIECVEACSFHDSADLKGLKAARAGFF